MKKALKRIFVMMAVAAFGVTLLAACGSKAEDAAPADAAEAQADGTDDEVPYRDQGIKYMGGLVSNEDGADVKLALFRMDGEPVAIYVDDTGVYYGSYETEDTKFDDGTEFTLININGTKFGYHFNDDMSGFIVDNDDNIFQAKELDEDTAMELMDMTLTDDSEGLTNNTFVEDQSGVTEFKDYDDIISHLKPGQGYARIKLYGSDDEILAITESVFEADDSAYEAALYGMKDGKPIFLSTVTGNGSAYPLRLADGILYAGDNHSYESYFMSSEYNSLMMKDSVTDGVNDGSNEYIGFLRTSNDYDHDEDFKGGEKEFQALIAERDSKPIIVFTRVS